MVERQRRSSSRWWQRAGLLVLSCLAIATGREARPQSNAPIAAPPSRTQSSKTSLLWIGGTFVVGLAGGVGIASTAWRRQRNRPELDRSDLAPTTSKPDNPDIDIPESFSLADPDNVDLDPKPAGGPEVEHDATDVVVNPTDVITSTYLSERPLVEIANSEPVDVLDLIRSSAPPSPPSPETEQPQSVDPIDNTLPQEDLSATNNVLPEEDDVEREVENAEVAATIETKAEVSTKSEVSTKAEVSTKSETTSSTAVKHALLQFARDAVVILDRHLTIVESNPLAAALFGHSQETLVGQDAIDILFPAAERARLREEASELLASATGPWSSERELHIQKPDGSLLPLDWVASRFLVEGEPHLLATARDLSPYKQAAAALQASEERYDLAVRGANDGLWDWDLFSSSIEFSPRWKAMLGYDDQEISANPDEWFDRIHPDDRERLIADITTHIKGDTPHFECEYRMLTRDRSYIWVLSRGLAVRNERNVAYRMAGSQTDITERRQAEANAYRDALSDLPNREAFLKQLEEAVGRANLNSNNKFAVLFLDCDRFKVINDSLGHAVGDRLIQIVARRLEVCVRPLDTVARLGGDEFVMLLREIKSLDDATVVADRILQQIMHPFRIDGHEVFITASIGIVSSEIGHRRAETILRDADTAMYRAKALGKSRYVVFDESMYSGAVQRQRIESDLRRALDNREFHLAFQPIVSVDTGYLSGFEALLRWRHPERSWISPAEFVPVAEDMGLITEIGQWVLGEACRQMQTWHQQFPHHPLTISVNFTSNQIIQPNFVETVRSTIDGSGCDAGSLRIELTESALVKNMETACHHLQSLRVLGVQAYIDDFGTGYSSLSYLQTLPLDALKIDRSFISNTESQPHSWKIVETIVTLAQSLGIVTIAEGVETQEQFSRLRQLGCEYVQGYFISPPLDSQRAAAFIAQEIPPTAGPRSPSRRGASTHQS
ncbi:MAG: EAL domain-containing protein [Cyanobacteria bacterium J06642_2]